jgi:signal transduction histidine kinase
MREQTRRKYLSKKLVEILEKERRDIAAALHNEIGQILTTINVGIDFIKEKMVGQVPTVLTDIDDIQDRIRSSTSHISALSHGLRPHILDNLGLVPALNNMVREIEKVFRGKCHFCVRNIPFDISGDKSLALYRIVQEALTNCLRHAHAKKISVNLAGRNKSILLTIKDDGIGFEYDEVSTGKEGENLGILIMNERAVQADGTFRIKSQIGKGTKITVKMPYAEAAVGSRPRPAPSRRKG